MIRTSIALLALAAMLSGCGGTGTSPGTTPQPSPTPPTGGALSAPIPVSVVAGSETGGVNITVPSPAASPAPNVQVLGLGTMASNTGAVVHPGTTDTVVVFGAGLTGNMQISISGANDIAVSNQSGVRSTTGLPGIQFDIQVAPNAALGARTVFFQDSQSDLTAFTGGLEVQP